MIETETERLINFLIKEPTNIHRIIRRCDLKESKANTIIEELYERGLILSLIHI